MIKSRLGRNTLIIYKHLECGDLLPLAVVCDCVVLVLVTCEFKTIMIDVQLEPQMFSADQQGAAERHETAAMMG